MAQNWPVHPVPKSMWILVFVMLLVIVVGATLVGLHKKSEPTAAANPAVLSAFDERLARLEEQGKLAGASAAGAQPVTIIETIDDAKREEIVSEVAGRISAQLPPAGATPVVSEGKKFAECTGVLSEEAKTGATPFPMTCRYVVG